MSQPRAAVVPETTEKSVRAKALEVLAHYASVNKGDPIPVEKLFQFICDGLVEDGIMPARDDGARFTSLESSHYTEAFPNYGASGDVASLVRQVLWELYVQGILSPSPKGQQVLDKYNQNPDLIPLIFQMDLDRAVVTPYGVQVLTDATNRIQVHDPEAYLANFLNADPPPDREMMRYLGECVAVFRGGHFLATIILLGVASERLIDVMAESLRDALGDSGGVKWFNTKYANKRDISTRFSSLSGKLMDEYSEDLSRAKLKDAFDGVVTLTVEQIRCARNDIAHPKGREFTWNEVSGFLHGFVQYFIYVSQIIKLLRSSRKGA
jgi:hypothetical protein